MLGDEADGVSRLCLSPPCLASGRRAVAAAARAAGVGGKREVAEVGCSSRASAPGPARIRPRSFPPSEPGMEAGRPVGERAETRGRICSLFAQSRRLWWGEVAGKGVCCRQCSDRLRAPEIKKEAAFSAFS